MALNNSIRLSLMFSQTLSGTGLPSIDDFWNRMVGSTVIAFGGPAQPRHGTLFCYVAIRATQGVLSGTANVTGPRVWKTDVAAA